jgi:hypothetical protein
LARSGSSQRFNQLRAIHFTGSLTSGDQDEHEAIVKRLNGIAGVGARAIPPNHPR